MPEFLEQSEYLIAAADELEEYLLSNADFWRLSGPNSFPPLTPGQVLLTTRRLSGVFLSDRELEKIRKALVKTEEVRRRWNSAWEMRVIQEIPQRLRLWSNYLEELAQTTSLAHQEFPWNVRWRVMLTLLLAETSLRDQETTQMVNHLDQRLRAISKPGPFIWAKSCESTFDRYNYWFLYLDISQSA